MYLTHLRLKDFAGLDSAVLDGFDRGLNVVVGDNEAGKSTLLMALRAAFFQKHRATGEAARALAPYGRQVRPEIEVGFEVAGTTYRLTKGFLQKPDASLAWPGGAAAGDAVEERLAELLGFAHPGRGESKLGEHQGAFGLLWVEQGRSHEHDLDLGVGRNAVTASLEGEIGQILGGDRGRALIAAAKARQDRFFTGTGRIAAASPLKEAEEALDALGAELAEKEAARRDYEGKIDRLRSRREVLHSYAKDDAEAAAGKALEAAEAEARAVSGFERAHQEALRDLDHALARRETAAERLSSRERLEKAARVAAAAETASRAALADLEASHAAERAETERLAAEREAARLAYAVAEARDEAALARAERLRLAADSEALAKRLGEVATLEARLAELDRADAAVRIDAKAVKALELAERGRREAEIRIEQTAATLRLRPLAGRIARDASGRPFPADEAVPLVSRIDLDLEGFGRLTLEPGGDAGELLRAHEEASMSLAALLARHKVDTVDAARGLVVAAEARRTEIALLRKQVESILPEGAKAAQTRLGAFRAALERLAEPPTRKGPGEAASHGADADDDPDADASPASRTSRKSAHSRLAAAEAALDTARRTHAAFAARLARAQAEAEHLAAAAARLGAELSAAGLSRATPALAEDLASAELDRAAKAALLALRRRALDEADPETVARSLQARRRALDEIRRTLEGLRGETAALEGELRAQGATALGEDISRLGGEIGTLDGRRRRLALEADAARLLHSMLTKAQSEAREHWLGPIKAEVAPFLKLIHPESEVTFDESTLAITGLNRRGVEEDFKRLSAGAREQVAVVTRLALAGVLKRGGHPALVILDDALVNTDELRLERMHKVLQKAAEAMQIIVLTCRERDFRALGGRMFRL